MTSHAADPLRPGSTSFFTAEAPRLIIIMAIMFVLLGAYAKSFGDAANSRLATVLSLSQHGTFYIDPVDGVANPFEQGTIDKVRINGHIMSSKPPMLPLFMTAQYIIMNKVFGYDLLDDEDKDEILRWMSIVLIGGSYILCLIFFHKSTGLLTNNDSARAFLLFCLAFCTQLWGYSGNINNHTPGAGALMVAVYFALKILIPNEKPSNLSFLLFGIFGGLTFALDMPATIFIAVAGLALLARYPVQAVIWGGIGMVPVVLLQVGIMYTTTGSPLPVQMKEALYLEELSYWRHPIAIDALQEKKGEYLFHMLVGRSGLFSLYPILLCGMAGAIAALRMRATKKDWAVILGFVSFILLSYYYLSSTDNYGGQSYGFRWYIVAMPVLLLMGVRVVGKMTQPWHRLLLSLMVAISFYSAWECTQNAWRANHEWTLRFLGKTYIW